MDELEVLVQDKTRVVLNLIRSNNTADDVLKITQAFRNIVEGENVRKQDSGAKTTRKQGAGS